MTGELYINGKDAWAEWGILMDGTSLSSLMTPPTVKDYPSNTCRLKHGTSYLTNNPKLAERDITLSLQFVAENETLFFAHYQSFCDELSNGTVDIQTKYQQGKVYHFLYKSCTSYSQFRHHLAKVSLKLTEPDPTNRTA